MNTIMMKFLLKYLQVNHHYYQKITKAASVVFIIVVVIQSLRKENYKN